MNKSEILSELKANGNISTFTRTPSWEKAFNLYNQLHPNDKKGMSCGHCYRTISKWLQS